MFNIKLEKRMETSTLSNIAVPMASVLLALIFCGFFLALTGFNPFHVYTVMFQGAFGSSYNLSETVVKAIPLILTGVGVAVAFRMQLWNIGAEGQLYMGAFAAGGVALAWPEGPIYLVLPAMVLAGCLAGALWAMVAAIPRAFLNVNETITTLLLNYVAIFWFDYLVHGPWRDPQGFNFPLSAPFTSSAILPAFGTTRIHWGLFFGIGAALILFIVMKYSKWGFEIKVIGESAAAARYAGINIKRNILLVMMLSGALAGLAGMAEVSGISQRLQPGLSPGYGYTAIIVAWLARLNPWAILGVSFLFGGLLVGSNSMQTENLPATTTYMIQGAILFFILGGELFTRYKVKITGARGIEHD